MKNDLLFQALIYLSAAVLFVPVAKKLGLGSVLGYFIAGMIIGPSVLNLVGDGGEEVMHVAEFGVIMMLFLIGLELDPATLWKLRTPILGMGGLQVVCTAALVGLTGVLLGISWKEGLILGLILALSSTAIVLQSLNEKGWHRIRAGRSAFAVLLFQDIAVIPILAVLPLLSEPGNPGAAAGEGQGWAGELSGVVKAAVVLGAMVLVVLIGRYVVGPLLRVVTRTGMRELFSATSLLLLAGIAFLMQQVGLSPALGAFLAGVVLASSEFRHELESDIEPFKGLLLGLFFISVGASLDLTFMIDHAGSVFTWLGILIALKILVLYVLGRAFGLSLDQNAIFTLSLAQMGEFAFVLFSVTSQLNLLSNELTNLMTAVVAVSMACTPLLLLVTEKWILPRIGVRREEPEPETGEIEEKNPVIIAGFGRMGNTIGRFLHANGITATILDYDSDRVEVLRKYGFKVYYGDTTRFDLLRSAGAEAAKIIVIALDHHESVVKMVTMVQKHFPHLKIIARAQSREKAYELIDLEVEHIYRETLDTSLQMGVDVMTMLGYRQDKMQQAALKFRNHDENAMKKLARHRQDSEYISMARAMIEELEQLIRADQQGNV